ncbi:hypothetical protein L204_105308 [Cryptococcus depauperatus]
MVFGIITATAICPAIVATTQAIEQGQKGNRKAGNKGQDLGLFIRFGHAHPYREKLEGARIVLKDGKLYVEHADSHFPSGSICPFFGKFLPVPQYQEAWARVGHKGDAFITRRVDDVTFDRVYVDAQTHELRYGTIEDATRNFCGPWDCTEIENRLLFEGWEGFVVVQEDAEQDLWAIYFDRMDDGLTGDGKEGGASNKRKIRETTARSSTEKERNCRRSKCAIKYNYKWGDLFFNGRCCDTIENQYVLPLCDQIDKADVLVVVFMEHRCERISKPYKHQENILRISFNMNTFTVMAICSFEMSARINYFDLIFWNLLIENESATEKRYTK